MNNNMNSAMKTVGVSLAVGTAAPQHAPPPLNRLRENAR